MRLRTKYILFIGLLHLVALVLSYYVFRSNKVLFIVSEAVLLFSLWLSWRFYLQLISPLKLLVEGAEAINSKDFAVKLQPAGQYEMDQLIVVYNRMIDELRQERIKQEQQHLFLEKLIHTSPTGIVILDYDQRVSQANPKAQEILRFHPVLAHIQGLEADSSMTVTYNNAVTYKLQKSHFIDRGFPRQFVLIEELTAEILAAEKKAYGKVIRMMAHEVNNTIGPVNSILQSAMDTPALSGSEMLGRALQVAIQRNQHLNMFMRNFADVVRLPEPSRQPVDLHQLVGGVARLMEMKALERDIRFSYQLSGGSFHIEADPAQLEQVLINIVKNALEAITGSGVVEFITLLPERKLVIADSGSGIDPGITEQLFSPFFSTKKNGQGIGLTLIREVLHQHGYELSLTTVAPGRTEFVIQF